jgi:hypothetical protein
VRKVRRRLEARVLGRHAAVPQARRGGAHPRLYRSASTRSLTANAKVANRNVWGFGWEMKLSRPFRDARRFPSTRLQRTHMCTYGAEVWDLSRNLLCRPVPNLMAISQLLHRGTTQAAGPTSAPAQDSPQLQHQCFQIPHDAVGWTQEAKDATVLIHEATFDDDMQAEAVSKKHSMTKEAVQTGVDAQVYRTILTHFSQRCVHRAGSRDVSAGRQCTSRSPSTGTAAAGVDGVHCFGACAAGTRRSLCGTKAFPRAQVWRLTSWRLTSAIWR